MERERMRGDGPPSGPGGPAPGAGSGGGEDLRRRSEDLLKAGDEAISRALSGDSEKFLAANRQRGGE